MSPRHHGRVTAAQLASVAALLADRSRAAICLALLDGRAWTVGELARSAGVAPSTASEHVARLRDGGLLVTVSQGRHRYVRLADARTAQFIEDAVGFASDAMPPRLPAAGPPAPRSTAPQPPAPRSLRAAAASEALARARTCYDHLAGRLGVAIADAMTRSGLLDQEHGFALTGAGLAWLGGPLGIDVAAISAGRRPAVRPCLDWTERRPHLGGAAGAAICEQFFAKGWITRIGTARAVAVSPAGQDALRELCGMDEPFG